MSRAQVRDTSGGTSSRMGSGEGKFWNRFLAEAQRNASGVARPVHCVLLISDSETLQRDFVMRLEQSLKVKDSRFFSSQESQSSGNVTVDGFGLGYTYLEVRSLQDPSADKEILEIYTLTYSQAGEFQRDALFVERFRSKENLTVVDLQDLERTIATHGELSARRIFEERAVVCAGLGRALESDGRSQALRDSFTRAKGAFYLGASSARASVEDQLELGNGECDSPIGAEYCLVVVGTEALGAGGMASLSQLEVDKLQQYLRVLALKCGGSVFYLSSLLQDLTPLARQILQSEQVPANVDDTLSICVPKGWDTRAKIKIVNEYCDLDSLDASWAEAWRRVVAEDQQGDRDDGGHVIVGTAAADDTQFGQYQDFLRQAYKTQVELEAAQSTTPVKADKSPAKEVMENTTVLGGDDADVSTSFHETHSMLQDFRAQFLEDDADLLAGVQSTPGEPRVRGGVAMAAHTPRFLEFFNDLDVGRKTS